MMSTARTSSMLAVAIAAAVTLSACGNGSHNANGPASSGTVNTPAHAATAPVSAHSAPATPASSQAAVSAPASAATAAPAAPVAAAASHAPISLLLGNAVGSDHRVSHPLNNFKPSDKAFFASVSTNGKSLGGTLNAKWLYLEGKKPLVISSVSQLISADSPSSTTFTVHNTNPWPEGRYKVEIALDGKSLTSQEFQVH